MSRDLDLHVIVEGVERSQQLELLLELGRPFAQDYLFSEPLDADECRRLLEEIEGSDAVSRGAWFSGYAAPLSTAL